MRSHPFNLTVVSFWWKHLSISLARGTIYFSDYDLLVCDIVKSLTLLSIFRGSMLETLGLLGIFNSFGGIWCLHLQGCIMWYCRWVPMFQKNMVLPPSWSISTYNTTRYHSPEGRTVRITTTVKTWKLYVYPENEKSSCPIVHVDTSNFSKVNKHVVLLVLRATCM
jgi:hypothetical protein